MTFPTYDPMTMPRTKPAYLAILNELSDGEWHSIQDLQYAATQDSDLTPGSIDKLIRWGYRPNPTKAFRPWRRTGKGQNRLIQQTRKD